LDLDKRYLIIYVDFGSSEWIHIKGIRPLHAEFAELQIQSIAVSLSHVRLDPFICPLSCEFMYRFFQKKTQQLVQLIGIQKLANNVHESYVDC
jgi:hypothetical protein